MIPSRQTCSRASNRPPPRIRSAPTTSAATSCCGCSTARGCRSRSGWRPRSPPPSSAPPPACSPPGAAAWPMRCIMRLADFMLALPALPLLVLLAAADPVAHRPAGAWRSGGRRAAHRRHPRGLRLGRRGAARARGGTGHLLARPCPRRARARRDRGAHPAPPRAARPAAADRRRHRARRRRRDPGGDPRCPSWASASARPHRPGATCWPMRRNWCSAPPGPPSGRALPSWRRSPAAPLSRMVCAGAAARYRLPPRSGLQPGRLVPDQGTQPRRSRMSPTAGADAPDHSPGTR